MIISIEGISIHAFHGVYEAEKEKGNDFELDVYLKVSDNKSTETDKLKDTIDYQEVYELVLRIMHKPAKLLEYVAQQIAHQLLDSYQSVESVKIKISKINPLYMDSCQKASVELSLSK